MQDPITGEEKEESLHVRAFYDKSVLEIFVNSRTAISTRVYPHLDRVFGLEISAEALLPDQEVVADIKTGTVWDGLAQYQGSSDV